MKLNQKFGFSLEEVNWTKSKTVEYFIFLVLLLCVKLVFSFVVWFFDLGRFEIKLNVVVPFWQFGLKNLLLIPLIEEGMCRLSLKWSEKFLKMSAMVIVLNFTLSHERIYFEVGEYIILRLLLAVFLMICIEKILERREVINWLKDKWSNHFSVVFLTFVAFFSFIHFNKYDSSIDNFLKFSPLIFLNYSIVGVFFSFVRLRLGFGASVIFHCAFNLPYFIFALSS